MSNILAPSKIQNQETIEPISQGLVPLNEKELKTEQVAFAALSEITENQSPILNKVTVQPAPKFQPLTEEQVNKMTIQQLLETILQACYLIQHDTKKLNGEFLHTLQNTLDLIVKRLSSQQSSTYWSIPSYLSITFSGLAGLIAPAKGVLEALGGGTKVIGDIMQQLDRSKETPINSELTQAQGTIQTIREKGPQLNNEEEQTLSKLERTMNELYQLLIGMAQR